MKARTRTLLVPIGVALAALLIYQFRHSAEWRSFSWSAFWEATRNVSLPFLIGATGLIYLSYVLRTFRWQILMSPTGRFWPVLRGTVIGFTGVALFGRPAELVRPYYIARKHRGDLSSQLAVWLLERAFDMGAVVLIVGLDLALDPRIHALTHDSVYGPALRSAGVILMAGVGAILIALGMFHHQSSRVLAWVGRRQAAHPRRLRQKLEYFLRTLAQGTAGLSEARTLLLAGMFTMMVWATVSGSLWMVVRGYPAMLPGFSFSEALLLMGLTAIGSVVQLPAVGGGFQVLTIFGLTKVFGAEGAAAASAALLIWLICFYAIAPFGAALAAHEGVSWRGIEHAAESAEQASLQSADGGRILEG